MNTLESSNQLINHLDAPARKLILKHSDELLLSTGTVLGQPGDANEYVYFPMNCVIALMLQQNEEKGMEICLVGREGMLGVEAILGVNESPYLILVQNEGSVLRIATEQLMKIIARHPSVEQHLHLYAGVLMQQLAQSSLCSHYHAVQARLARLILMFRDRLHSNTMQLTHGLLADMLGVRRVGVTKAAGALQKRRILRYARGHIEITNEGALEAISCVCYATDKATYDTNLIE
ncbi:MAG: hypothetical protein B7Y48_08105 [Methylophilales bacterium 28-44-11]|nr:MAG: hypothetical protein B7Y48_08105 [Methylophilales bacterium 28-44-11]